jgi:hypothetical protein
VRLAFGPDEEEGFSQARERVLERLDAWAEEHGAAKQAWIADTALDYKFGYGDGELGRWTAGDLKDFLLEWCPRKLTLDEEGIAEAVASVATFLRFLDDDGLFDGRGDHLAALEATLEWIAPRFAGAMRDTSRFGMAKTIATAIGAAGIDVSDEAAVGQVFAGYRLPPEVGLPGESPGTRRFDPVRLALDGELTAAAAESPLVRRLRTLTGWVGTEGRKLTGAGNLTVADGKHLVAELGLVDPERLASLRVRSAADLPGLDPLLELAKHLRLVRVYGGRLRAVKQSRQLVEDPLLLCGRVVEAITTSLASPSPMAILEERLAGGTSEAAFELLESLYEGQAPCTLGDFAGHLWDDHIEPLGDGPDPTRIAGLLRLAVEVEVGLIAGLLEETGLLEVDRPGEEALDGARAEVADPTELLGAVNRRTRIRLTPLGLYQTNILLRAAGADAPVLGELAGADVAALVEAVAGYDEPACRAELRAWCAERGERAVRELGAYLRSASGFEQRMLAFAALDEAGPAAEAEVRALLDEPQLRPFARVWLVQQGLEDPRSLDRESSALLMAESLGSILDQDGPDGLLEYLGQLGPPTEQADVLGDLWRAATPRAAELLGVVAKAHASAQVAKAARKAAFKLRTATRR